MIHRLTACEQLLAPSDKTGAGHHSFVDQNLKELQSAGVSACLE